MNTDSRQKSASTGRLDAAERIAVGLSVMWALMCAAAFLFLPSDSAGSNDADPATSLMGVLAVVMPIVLIWVAALAARNFRLIRQENRQLRSAVARLQKAPSQNAGDTAEPQAAPLAEKIVALERAQKSTEAALARLASVNLRSGSADVSDEGRSPDAMLTPEPAEETEQPRLALDAPTPAKEPVSVEDFIRALNFPKDERDQEGFRALRVAMADRSLADLLRSAEDILTLLAEDGIYVDDLHPDRAHPDVWRKFASGQRGGVVSSLGGLRNRENLAKTAGRMRHDPVFRDCAHHFLRRFDSALTRFSEFSTDEEIAAFADTRSARAFMLVGRVSGMFD